ncbi:MAG: replicative DNA helicase [Candidatus Sericytochromatia bacterium]
MADPGSTVIERTPPHNKEAEIAVLGGMILDSEALAKVIQMLEPDYFYMPAHSLIYDQIRELFSRGQPVDFISITDALRGREQLDRAGGSTYIMTLIHSIPTTANIEYYAAIVERYAILRKLIRAGTKIVELGFSPDEKEISFVLNEAEQTIFDIGQHKLGDGLKHIQTGLWHLFEELEKGYSDPEAFKVKNLATGFTDLNHMLGGGFEAGQLIILAARPAMGKTALALNVAVNMATLHDKPVAIFNLEMSEEQLITRMLCMESGMNSRALRSGTLHTDEWQNLSNAIAKLTESPIYIDDSSQLMPGDLRAKCRRLKAEHKELSLIIIDYLQLMDTGMDNRVQEISKISRSLKQLARELEVPVIALSQLNRAVETRTNKRPMLSDLRESGAIEQDADIVLFLYRDEYYNPDSNEKKTAELIIAKHRQGPTGTVRLYFEDSLTRFGNLMLD